MRAVQLAWCLLILVLVLVLRGCAWSPTAEQVAVPAQRSSSMRGEVPTVGATRPAGMVVIPTRLRIPAIGVNAQVEPLGMLPNGDMATPMQRPWDDVGWYNAGPHPGERGSAVIDGHLDRPGGYPAVFWHLRDLYVGAAVLVITSAGQTLRFQVTHIALYMPQAAPLQDIFGNKGGTYLNLITCAGDWIPSEHQTTLRLVVYTSLA